MDKVKTIKGLIHWYKALLHLYEGNNLFNMSIRV